jgi:transposase InsO family protein
MGLHNDEIIAHRMASRPTLELVSVTLQAALSRTECASELIVHSDQGRPCEIQPHRTTLASRGVVQSTSRKGNCSDGAVIESFFDTFKAEYLHFAPPNGVDKLETEVHDYVHYYDHERIKLGLRGLSPVQYRLRGNA